MTQPTRPDPQESRLAGQPAPRPIHPVPAREDHRPSYDELMAQTDSTDYSPLAGHLDDETRSALGLPAAPRPLVIDHQLLQRIRAHLLDNPAKVAALPDSIRDLIHL
ncbi:hypothetical protein [Streptomyces yaizuensis]|uniref:Uncharacterized protein n=1 Tax=Streptomyces yaizuensis TaxID=2989713 RepID=A0ABQ5P6L9_9ACTN|nr:hypothetical protein [Streptomyces sp. YSPA8]GLF98238.1 hypothetical protein SYYSPA8_28095 [Streptomyces sp. YSPA8]